MRKGKDGAHRVAALVCAAAMVATLLPVQALAEAASDTATVVTEEQPQAQDAEPEETVTGEEQVPAEEVQTEQPEEEPAEETTEQPAEEALGQAAEEPAADVETDAAQEPAAAENEAPEVQSAAPAASQPQTVPAAAEENAQAPAVAGLAIGENQAVYNTDGSLYLAMPAEETLAGQSISLQTDTAVDFVPDAAPENGDIYVVSATENSVVLALNVTFDQYSLSDAAYHITLTTTDHQTWTGSFPVAYSFPISALDEALSQTGIQLAAGSMTARQGGAANGALRLVCNLDNTTALLVGCPADTMLYQVTYTFGEESYLWQLPAGAPLYAMAPALSDGETITWYSDAGFQTPIDFSTQTVNGNMTVYGKVEGEVTDSNFGTQLDQKLSVLEIQSMEDWQTFTQRSGEITANQRVELLTDINCGGASYQALTFAGSLDGKGHTISNASFSARGENAGLFAELRGVVVNLTLEDITVSNATYSGVLAGSISGAEGASARIQNVQVRSSHVTGRSAGGLAGFAIWAEILYCSAEDSMQINGTVNVGGLVGISYANIHDCYTNLTPTALLFRGGIAGKNLEGGKVEHCWCTYRNAAGYTDGTSTAVNNVGGVTSRTAAEVFTQAGFNAEIWSIDRGTNTTFTDNIYYSGFGA